LALGGCEESINVIVYQRTPTACNMVDGRDRFAWRMVDAATPECAQTRRRRAPFVHSVHVWLDGQTNLATPAVGQRCHRIGRLICELVHGDISRSPATL
jgi:hypothetical protein